LLQLEKRFRDVILLVRLRVVAIRTGERDLNGQVIGMSPPLVASSGANLDEACSP
jgi:hypothetical protein